MACTREEIEGMVRNAVKDVTGIEIKSSDTSLIDRETGIIPADFLYIFDQLEQKLQAPVCGIFAEYTYEVMTVKNLVDALYGFGIRTAYGIKSAC